MAITRIEFIKQQLKGLAPDADWNMSGVDRLQELAEVLERHGITDLWQLKLVRAQVTIHTDEWVRETESSSEVVPASDAVVDGFAFEYYGQRFGFLGGPDEFVNEPMFEQTSVGNAIAWSARGHGNVTYVVRPNKAKTALEIVPIWQSSSDAGFIRQSLIMAVAFFASVLLPVVGTAVGTAVGSAVVPASFAAAYPGVTAAIGNIAISTALNGGNIERAVKGYALGYVGSSLGAMAGGAALSVTDSTVIASLADVAARTAVTGGDLKTAVGMAAVRLGAESMFNFDTSSGVDWFSGSFEIDPGAAVFGDESTFLSFDNPLILQSIDIQTPTFDFSNQTLYDFTATGGGNAPLEFDTFQFNPFLSTDSSAAFVAADTPAIPAPAAPTQPPPPTSPAYNPVQVVQQITQAALAALSLVRAYRSLDTPAIQPTARVVLPNGSVSVIGDNGLIQTRAPNGQVTATRPPVSVPQATLSGNYIVNNGDGSYSVVSPDGRRVRYSYNDQAPPQAGAGMPTWAWAAAGVAAVFLLSKR